MFSSNPLVSIVIPCYNQGHYLRQAIESILSQDYSRIELIVLDDGSTDDTRAVLVAYAGRFHCESHANIGQAATLNKGWRMSRGEILSYLAADDFLLPGAVGTSADKLIANPEIVLTYCDFNRVDPESHVIWNVRTPEFSYKDLAVGIVCQPGPGVFFRRDAFERAGPWNERLRQTPDYEYWLRLGLEGEFARIPEILAAYRMHDQSQSLAEADPRKADEMVNVVSEHFRTRQLPPEISRAEPQALSNAHIISGRQHLRSGRLLTALNHLHLAFTLYPNSFLRLRTWRLIVNGLINRIGYRVLWQLRRVLGK
ncbi:MAG TPA: glycosyltransferase family 2 protein [Burkholderiales bacterium]